MYNGGGGDHDVDQDWKIDIFASAYPISLYFLLLFGD